MTENIELRLNDIAVEPFFRATQEMLSGAAINLTFVKQSTTVVRIPAGAADEQVSISVDGRYRYRTTNLDLSHPGGAAGEHILYLTAADNDFAGVGESFVDSTVYTFAGEIRTSGTPSTDLWRAAATVTWSGSQITRIVPIIPNILGPNAGQLATLTQTVGDGSATTITVTHNFNTRNIDVTVRESGSPYRLVFPEVQAISTSQVSLLFAEAPTSAQYTVIITSVTPAVEEPDLATSVFVAAFGDGAASSFVVNHNLGTQDALVSVRRVASPYDEVEVDVEFTTVNSVTLRTDTYVPSSNEFLVTIVAAASAGPDVVYQPVIEIPALAEPHDSAGTPTFTNSLLHPGPARVMGTIGNYAEWGVHLAAGEYAMTVLAFHDADLGILEVTIDNAVVATVDTYAASPALGRTVQSAIVVASSGRHELRGEVIAANPSSSGDDVHLCSILLTRTGAL